MKGNNKVMEQVVAHHRRYCMSCGTHLAQVSSRRVGLCQACRRHCVCCGKQTGAYGYYDVCLTCRTVVDKTIEYMKRHKGQLPSERGNDRAAPRRADCVSCGDPAEAVFDGKPYCAECHAELEGGPGDE